MNQNKIKIDPNYISGLTQADGSFFCSIKFRSNFSGLHSLQFVPTFTITVDLDSIAVLYLIQEYFNCGNINTSISRHTAEFTVVSFEDIVKYIIPHFNLYPLFFEKLHAFLLFEEIINILKIIKSKKRNYYFSSDILIEELRQLYLKIVLNALSMNKSSLRKEERIEAIYNKLNVPSNSIPTLIPYTINNITSSLHLAFLSG
jgi:LAGLIDADG DNA endonuclease family protein